MGKGRALLGRRRRAQPRPQAGRPVDPHDARPRDPNVTLARRPLPRPRRVRARASDSRRDGDDRAEILHHHRDLLSERRAAYRPRLRGAGDRRDRALPAARRLRRLLPDRHRRARHQDEADGGARGHRRRASSPTATRRCSRRWSRRSAARTTTSSAPPSRATTAPSRRSGGGWQAAGDIYKDSYAGWYSVRDEAYYAESETEVGADNVRYGPQGTPVEWVEEESYFFRLSAYQDRLLAHYEANPDFIGPDERRNEVVSFVKGGLKDLSISRTTFDWGIPVPGDAEARDVCLGRRAHQLHHRRRLSRRRRRRSGATGRPTCTSSARTSSASTRSTGRPS